MTDANTSYLDLSYKQALQGVFIGHRVTTPRLFGVADSGNGLSSNTDEMRVGLQIFLAQVIEPKQRMITDALSLILTKNGTPAELTIIPNTPIDVTVTPAPQPAAAQQQLSAVRNPSAEDEEKWISKLSDSGEVIDSDEWELIAECEAAGSHEDEKSSVSRLMMLSIANEGSYANGDEKSKWGDSGLYKLRYAYSQNIADDSRQFCKRMVALSSAGKVFRYEDIEAMGSAGVNGQFAPEGQSTYDIFAWKGGVYCHHFWKRQIYFRKRDANGKILPNDGLKNDIRVANVPFVPQKGFESIAPIKTPTRGSLKYP